MKRTLLSLAVLTLLFTATTAKSEEILLSTGSGPLDSIINPVKDAFEKETGIRLNILFGSATLAFKQLYKGVSEVGIIGTSLEDVITILDKEGFVVKDPASFHHVTLGRGMVRTVVNRENPVSKLSKEQLRGIFTGKITNWKEVGGNNAQIMVVISTLNPATTGTFRKTILDNAPYTLSLIHI